MPLEAGAGIDLGTAFQGAMAVAGFLVVNWMRQIRDDNRTLVGEMKEIRAAFGEQAKELVRLETVLEQTQRTVERLVGVTDNHEERLHEHGTRLQGLLGEQRVRERQAAAAGG